MDKRLMVGGQAVIEGVMMRSPGHTATAVRDPEGHIKVQVKEIESFSDRHPVFKKPFLRGVVSLIESLVIGIRSLSYSAQMAGDEGEQLTDREMAMTILAAFAFAAVLFIAIPTGAAKLFAGITDDPVFLNLMEGLLRLLIFLAYIWGISLMKDIHRVFEYHGAEHRTIRCYEAGLPLTVENVQKFSRFHPRCGTSFLLIVMIVSIFVFAFLGWPNLVERILSRVLLLPVVAGISYEVIRFSAKSKTRIVHLFVLPGLWLQHITTNPPKDDMAEVAIESLKAVLPPDEILEGSPDYIALSEGNAGDVNEDGSVDPSVTSEGVTGIA